MCAVKRGLTVVVGRSRPMHSVQITGVKDGHKKTLHVEQEGILTKVATRMASSEVSTASSHSRLSIVCNHMQSHTQKYIE